MENKILQIPNLNMFNNDWNLLLKFMENEGNPPFHFDGNLKLYDETIKSLGSLVSVGGSLDLVGCRLLTSLGELETISDDLKLRNCVRLESLGNLKYVGGCIYTDKSPFEFTPMEFFEKHFGENVPCVDNSEID